MCQLPPGSVHCVSAPSQLQQSGAFQHKYAGVLFYFWQMPEHDAAIQPNLAQSTQEVTHRNNNITSGYFSKYNPPCWRQHTNLKKETITSSSSNPSVRITSCCCFYNTYTYNCSREWLCDYCGNSSVSWRQLSTILRHGRLKTQPVGFGGRRSKTGSAP